jgi:hypothetical protein
MKVKFFCILILFNQICFETQLKISVKRILEIRPSELLSNPVLNEFKSKSYFPRKRTLSTYTTSLGQYINT